MVTESELVEEFKFMGIEKLDIDILIKCIEITVLQKIDAERLVEEWIAFAQTNFDGNLQPTLSGLDSMVRKQFKKNQDKVSRKSEKEQTKIKVYNSNNTSDIKHILNTYNAATPKKSTVNKRKNEEQIVEELSNFSPASYNPDVSKPSTVYAERTDRGKELEIFGASSLLEQDSKTFTKVFQPIQVKLSDDYETWSEKLEDGRYMFEQLDFEADAISNRIERIGQILMKKHVTEDNKNSLKYGRVRCDGDGRLNAYSILLEQSQQTGKGESIGINLQNISKFALFPGQIILLQATLQTNNMRKNILIAEQLYSNAIADFPKEKPKIEGPEPMKIVVACGPYTLSDNLAYQPLQDLIKYIVTNKPHVVILIGPFVNKDHSSIAAGIMAETFKSHFLNLMEQIITPLKHTNIQVIVVSSTIDAHHHSVYPTPPFDPLPKQRFNFSHVHMASDPSLINLNDLIIGVTSADILFHLAKTEFIFSPQNTDRMARFAEHILSQRSFYPIYPSQQSLPGQNCFPVDQQLMSIHGEFNVTPHILILPSNLKYFVKNINGCIVVNPERLTKGFVGGTFASINVYPDINSSVDSQITCRIIKI